MPIEVLEPNAEITVVERKAADLLDRLDGKIVAYHHARGPYLGVSAFADRLGELLLAKHGIRDFVKLKSIVDNGAAGWSDPDLPAIIERVYDKYAKQVDCVVVGAAFCGGSTYWSTQAACEFQDRGVPSVLLVSAAFRDLAQFTCEIRGYRELPMLELPDDFETKNEAEMHVLAERHVGDAARLVAKQGVLAAARA